MGWGSKRVFKIRDIKMKRKTERGRENGTRKRRNGEEINREGKGEERVRREKEGKRVGNKER